MKKVLFLSVAFLLVTVASSQTKPTNYDGGSELQNTIRKSKSKKTIKKTASDTTHVYSTETTYIPETSEEKLYRLTYGHSSPDYVKRVMESDAYKKEVAENQRTEEIRYQESKLRQQNDSIAKREKDLRDNQNLQDAIAKSRSKQDSIDAKNKSDRDAYLEDQKKQQKKNRRSIFGL